MATVNKEMEMVRFQWQKRGSYHHYGDEASAKNAKHSRGSGTKATAERLSNELGHIVTKSTVRKMHPHLHRKNFIVANM